MSLRFAAAFIATAAVCGPMPADEPESSDRLRAAAAKALARVQQSQAVAVRKENCASCHHQLLPEMPLALARGRGVPIDAKSARGTTLQTFGFLKDFDLNVQGHLFIDVEFDASLLVAAHEAGVERSLSTDALAQFVAGRQLPDGGWRIMDSRPPQSKSRITCTANCARAVRDYLPESLADEKRRRLAKAREWLLQVKPRDTEDRSYQLFGLLWTDAVAADRQKAMAALLSEQRPDGGWAQLPGRESDAYATGQALSALHVAGGLSTGDTAYQRGLKFLLSTQRDDGTWLVNTRLFPPAPLSPPMFSSGFPHGKDQFISLFGTTWAATALLHALPQAEKTLPRLAFPELAPDVKGDWVRVALNGNATDLKKLLDAGTDANSKTPAGTTALMLAARDPDKVKLLLERGADPKARARSGWDALLVAARFHGSAGVIEMLLKAGARPNPEKGTAVLFDASPVFFAASAGDVAAAGKLLDAGARPNQRMKMLGKIGSSPLQYAVSTGDVAMTEYLIKRGGDANETDPDDQISMLGWAAITNHVAVADLLLARGARVDHRDTYGMTPLLYAASIDYGDTRMVERLVAAGADVRATTTAGKSALDLARAYRHAAIANWLAGKSGRK